MREATLLRQVNQPRNALGGFVRVDLNANVHSRTAGLDRALQDGAAPRGVQRLLDCRLSKVDPGELRTPRKLGEQSKRDGGAEVAERRWSCVTPT